MIAEIIAVGLGDVGPTRADASRSLVAHGLGSCIAVCLFDPDTQVAGMAHVVLPGQDPRNRPNARFAANALPSLLESLVAIGGSEDLRCYQARLAGGAHVLASGPRIGELNAQAVRIALAKADVPIYGEHLGGPNGRTVWFDPREGGRIRVRIVGRDEILL